MSSTLESPPVSTTVGNHFISNYPPFSCWTPQEVPKFLHALSRTPKASPLGLYVHLPFCRHRCHYCYFRVYPRRTEADVNLYVESLLKELALYRRFPAIEDRSLRCVYFGGGTPSYLSSEQIRTLLGGLQEQLPWETIEECTFECEPVTASVEKFQLLKQLGVTRVSLGFQSLNDEILRRSGRDTRVSDCHRAFHQARAAGFDEINIDLLAGLPDESDATWRRTIDQVLELIPDCVSIYQLELTHNSKLYASMRAGHDVNLPSWPDKCQWTDAAFKMCEEAGYVIASGYMAVRNPRWWRFVYAVDHFWQGADLLALGETSFGHIQGVHYQNVDTFDRYTTLLAENHLPLRRAFKLSPEHKLRREVMLLLKTGRLDAAHFRKKFGVVLLDHFEEQFEQLLRKGLVEIEADEIRLTREALLRVDWLLPMFYLPEHTAVRYT